jgi:hypothetical protein
MYVVWKRRLVLQFVVEASIPPQEKSKKVSP